MSDLSFEATIDYGKAAIKGAFAINGGAIIALLTFLGSNMKQLKIATGTSHFGLSGALVVFAVGLVLSVGAAAAAYISQGKFTLEDETSGQSFRTIAIAAWVFSILAFLGGAVWVACYFIKMGI